MKRKFLLCKHCGNLIEVIDDAGVNIICCGSPMEELVPNTTDAATEKHVPSVTLNSSIVTVKVGEIEHPMSEEHFIKWIYLETSNGVRRVDLTPSDEPSAVFTLNEGESVKSAYAYCNLHGLWKKDI